MRATIKNYIEAVQKRRQEEGEEGFSLIELIVVVAILGVLVAIAIPVFTSIQATAEQNALKTIAANGATQAAASLANGESVAATNYFANLSKDDVTVDFKGDDVPGKVGDICVTASKNGVTMESGPGC